MHTPKKLSEQKARFLQYAGKTNTPPLKRKSIRELNAEEAAEKIRINLEAQGMQVAKIKIFMGNFVAWLQENDEDPDFWQDNSELALRIAGEISRLRNSIYSEHKDGKKPKRQVTGFQEALTLVSYSKSQNVTPKLVKNEVVKKETPKKNAEETSEDDETDIEN